MLKKKSLSSGKWLVLFVVTVLLVALLIPVFNIITDPYGAFGDPVLQWWSYDMTLNPRLAKLTYLEKNHENYDSYIIGSSGSSAIPVELLNEYLDAKFYNTFFYGTETQTFEEIALYLLDRYPMKNLVLNLSPLIASSYKRSDNKLTKYQYWKVNGLSPLTFYSRYLLIDPMEGVQKLKYLKNDGYLQAAYKVFLPETGAYDKSRRDAEPIDSLEKYLNTEPYKGYFVKYTMHHYSMPYLEQSMETVTRIKKRCAEKDVNLIVICQPMYYQHLAYYTPEDQAAFYNALAQVTDYWDFTLSSVSYDPRFFYDSTHCRNAVGAMELAAIFGDETVYVPEGFGRRVEQGSLPGAPTEQKRDEAEYSVQVPILRYHHIVEGSEATGAAITYDAFVDQMTALYEAGYTTVDIWQLRDYVEKGVALPEKPLMITFDDGYESNYTLAFPLLQQYSFKATIFAIGVSIGKDTYKDTGVAMTPHFSLEQAKEMTDSGLITVASHGYNVHEVEGRDPSPIRLGLLQREDETEDEYVAFLTEDAEHMFQLLGEAAGFFSYPTDRHDERSMVILRQAGIFATVSGNGTAATLIKGLPQSLLSMPRTLADDSLTGAEMVALLEGGAS